MLRLAVASLVIKFTSGSLLSMNSEKEKKRKEKKANKYKLGDVLFTIYFGINLASKPHKKDVR